MSNETKTCHVAVLDMQPIDPPVGGGRIRLWGLYHRLGESLPTTYVGTYDWPGPGFRHHRLSPSLEEIDVPLSEAHFAVHERWKARVGGRVVIDTTFGLAAGLSTEYLRHAGKAVAAAEVVVFSHPWVYPLLRDRLRDEQLLVYDAHNFEGLLRTELWDDGGPGSEVAKHVVSVEAELARRADAVLSCSEEDSRLFMEVYGVAKERLLDAPNGVFTEKLRPPSPAQKDAARATLKLEGAAAMFIGSAYQPNAEAAELIVQHLAPALPEVTFLICGGVCDAVSSLRKGAPANVRFLGQLSEEEKQRCLWAADIGLNPMSSGSGTNIKMFDYMAAGLPVVSTPVGARGIAGGEPEGLWVADADQLALHLARLAQDAELRARSGAAARARVCDKYSWEAISPRLGASLYELWERKRASPRREEPLSEPSNQEKVARPGANPRTQTSGARVALLTTWRTRCGIAEYAQYLARALEARGIECLVVDGTGKLTLVGSPGVESLTVRLEDMVAQRRRTGAEVAAACRKAGADCLLVQHHPGFLDEQSLLRIISGCRTEDITVVVTCHNTHQMAVDALVQASDAGARLVVHNLEEAHRLQALGVHGVSYIPHGILEVEDEDRAAVRQSRGWKAGPIIGTFGFLRPHKGLPELIEAYALVREVHPEARLLALTALYPSEDSRKCLARCTELLAERGFDHEGRVHLDIAFHDIEHVIRRLHACDVIVLPYHASDEGGSGAAAIALAARRPVLTTRSKVFRDTLDFTYTVESIDPFAIALGICNLLSSPGLQQSLLERCSRFIDTRSWSAVAALYEAQLLGDSSGLTSLRRPA